MEYSLNNIHSFTIPVRTSLDSGSTLGYGFIHEGQSRTLKSYPQNDFYLPVFLTRIANLIEYVDVDQDETIFVMQRQEVNPWFVEFSFFDTIERNKVNSGSDLTNIMLNYIRSIRPDISSLVDNDIKMWFDTIGRYELPWNKGKIDETSLDNLEKISIMSQDIVSKAFFNNIDINS